MGRIIYMIHLLLLVFSLLFTACQSKTIIEEHINQLISPGDPGVSPANPPSNPSNQNVLLGVGLSLLGATAMGAAGTAIYRYHSSQPETLLKALEGLPASKGKLTEAELKQLDGLFHTNFELKDDNQKSIVKAWIEAWLEKPNPEPLKVILVNNYVDEGFDFLSLLDPKPNFLEYAKNLTETSKNCEEISCMYDRAYDGLLLMKTALNELEKDTWFTKYEEFTTLADAQYALVALRKKLVEKYKEDREAPSLYDALNWSIDSIMAFFTRNPNQLAGNEFYLPARLKWPSIHNFLSLVVPSNLDAGIRHHKITGNYILHYKDLFGQEQFTTITPSQASNLVTNFEDYQEEKNPDHFEEKIPFFRSLPKQGNQVLPGETDVIQGGLGDCYLLAALGAAASAPTEEDTSPTKKQLMLKEGMKDETGYVLVRAYIDNNITWIPVDKTIYGFINKKTEKFESAFARTKTALWPLYYEYAFAMLHGGNFAHIIGDNIDMQYSKDPAIIEKNREKRKNGEPFPVKEASSITPMETFFNQASYALFLWPLEAKLINQTPPNYLSTLSESQKKELFQQQAQNELIIGKEYHYILSTKPKAAYYGGSQKGWEDIKAKDSVDGTQYEHNPLANQFNLEKIKEYEKELDRIFFQELVCRLTPKCPTLEDLQIQSSENTKKKWISTIAYAGTAHFKGNDTSGNAGENTATLPGLVGDHAYQIKWFEFNPGDERKRYRIELRNPWGNLIPSVIYHNETKEISGYQKLEHDTFSMTPTEFFRYFEILIYTEPEENKTNNQ